MLNYLKKILIFFARFDQKTCAKVLNTISSTWNLLWAYKVKTLKSQLTSVSKKLAQTTAVYHYCILCQFFWNRLYSKSPRNFWNYGAKYIVLMSDFWPLARQSGPRNSFVGRPFIRHLPKYHSISSCCNFGQVWTCL